MTLQMLQQWLEDEGYETVFEAASEELPLDQLLLVLPGDEEEGQPDFPLQLVFLPTEPGYFEAASLLQYYVSLPTEVAPSALDEVRRLLPALNLNLPLMAFNLHDEGLFLYFRYVHVLPMAANETTHKLFLETVALIHFLVEQFFPVLHLVGTGERTVAELVAEG